MGILTRINMITILMVSVTAPVSMSEPLGVDCNRFVYEYKLMERLLMLEQENKLLKTRLDTLEKVASPTSVAVKVRLSSNQDLTSNSKVMYDTVIANVGKAYDLEQGQFVAPVSGIYLVTVQACLGYSAKWMDLDVLLDGAAIGRVFSGDSAYHNCGAESVSLHIDKGSKIWVVRVAGTAKILNQDHGWNSFTAVLIQQDFNKY